MSFFFFNDTATTEIYTLSLHDALPISDSRPASRPTGRRCRPAPRPCTSVARNGWSGTSGTRGSRGRGRCRSEEHTSELQSRQYLVCRLLLEKKKERPASNRCRNRELQV